LFSFLKHVFVPRFKVRWASWGNLSTLDWGLAHGGFLVLESLESALEDLEGDDDGASGPEEPVEGGEDGVGTCSCADGATAEEEFTDESSEGDETGEVEEGVEGFECEVSVWVGCYKWLVIIWEAIFAVY
jgi:hypothetical protein